MCVLKFIPASELPLAVPAKNAFRASAVFYFVPRPTKKMTSASSLFRFLHSKRDIICHFHRGILKLICFSEQSRVKKNQNRVLPNSGPWVIIRHFHKKWDTSGTEEMHISPKVAFKWCSTSVAKADSIRLFDAQHVIFAVKDNEASFLMKMWKWHPKNVFLFLKIFDSWGALFKNTLW